MGGGRGYQAKLCGRLLRGRRRRQAARSELREPRAPFWEGSDWCGTSAPSSGCGAQAVRACPPAISSSTLDSPRHTEGVAAHSQAAVERNTGSVAGHASHKTTPGTTLGTSPLSRRTILISWSFPGRLKRNHHRTCRSCTQ